MHPRAPEQLLVTHCTIPWARIVDEGFAFAPMKQGQERLLREAFITLEKRKLGKMVVYFVCFFVGSFSSALAPNLWDFYN